ncbi:hypothetical protein GN316_20380 [Xylophilus sp. Kf1]|nr:hypothetical protein [Xylophilus sp. Kf1]
MEATGIPSTRRPPGECLRTRGALMLGGVLLFTADLALGFSGSLHFDATGALHYARATTHAEGQAVAEPAMRMFWQAGLLWAGLLLMADGLFHRGRRGASWALLLVAATALVLGRPVPGQADSGMAALWILGGGMIFWHRSRQIGLGPYAVAALWALLVFLVPVRPDNAFAVAPLLIYELCPQLRFSRTREWATAAGAITVLVMLLGHAIHRQGLSNGIFEAMIFDAEALPEFDFQAAAAGWRWSGWQAGRLAWPVAGLALAAGSLALIRGERRDETLLAARALALSAMLHLAAALAMGTAGDARSAGWAGLALPLAAVLGTDALLRDPWRLDPSRRRRWIRIGLLALLSAGATAWLLAHPSGPA